MRNIFFLILSISMFFTYAGAQQPVTADQKRAAGEVMATISKWAEAVRDRDVKRLDSIFADDVIITTFDGKVRGKAAELEVMKPIPNLRTSSVTNEDVEVKVFANVGVVTALTRMKFVSNGNESNLAMRYTAVFVKRDGTWQIVALQTVRVPAAAA